MLMVIQLQIESPNRLTIAIIIVINAKWLQLSNLIAYNL